MTYVLVCALCASTPSASPASPLELSAMPALGSTAGAADLAIRLRRAAPLRHDGAHSDAGEHGSGSHVGPMWIVMGVMMVAMMATVGIYMMRGGSESPRAAGAMPVPRAGGGPAGRLELRFGAG